MRLLVSVQSVAEAVAGLEGGADLIDAKDPHRGAMGSVSPATLGAIVTAVDGRRPVTAAIGDAADATAIARIAREFTSRGAEFVKVAFAGVRDTERVRALADAAVRGARSGRDGAGVVVVAYADADRIGSITPGTLVRIAPNAGARGLLVDTADKSGLGLSGLVDRETIAGWRAELQSAGLFLALAGKLSLEDLDFARECGADIAGVRGAACEGGRIGQVVANRVRLLKERCALPLTIV